SQNSGSGARRGLWYTVIGTGTTITVSTCPTSPTFDSVVGVFCGNCDGMSVVAGNDDAGTTLCAASSLLSVASWCSTAGQTYYVWVSHTTAGAQTNAFSLKVTDDSVACSTARPCTICTPTCPAGSTIEDETNAGQSTNDGCDASTVNPSTAQVFSDVTVG